ncbi:MAG: transglutaminase family protein, partial [Planctomycetaceae bacterium]|nr:transglutaminase family protein [Planctomycetaceae bacterium]
MKYRIVHTTAYQYSAPVSLCRNQVMLTPRESAAVSCQSHRLTIRPHPGQTSRRTDAFGNSVHVFSLEENHSQLSITATSRLTISERTLP